MTHKATCQTCKQFAIFSSRRSIATSDLPLVLAVNASAYNDENLSFWLDNRNQTFLTPQVGIQGQVEGSDDPDVAVYKLRVRFLCNITNSCLPGVGFRCAGYIQREALSSGCNSSGYVFSSLPSPTKSKGCSVPEAEERTDLQSPWFVFNDFVVRNVSEEEALSFPGKWKVRGVTSTGLAESYP
jgi:hypothetical protein